MSFNSKLVRLKAVMHCGRMEAETHLFQFQTGSIKSRYIRERILEDVRFQFQTGSIKS